MSSTNSTAMARTCKLRSAGLVLCGCEAERKSDEGAARKNAHWLTPGRRSACPTLAPTGRSEADMKLIFTILVHCHPPERFMVLRERRLEQKVPYGSYAGAVSRSVRSRIPVYPPLQRHRGTRGGLLGCLLGWRHENSRGGILPRRP